ncbi:MAG: helix-turn-helix transcriptional regulator [Pirellula sp.]
MTSISLTRSRYLRPGAICLGDSGLFRNIASKNHLPPKMFDDPESLIPLHAAHCFYLEVAKYLGLQEFMGRMSTIVATQVFDGQSYLATMQRPASLESLLIASNPLGIESNQVSVELKVGGNDPGVLEIKNVRHSDGVWIQDLLGVHFLKWRVQYFEPSFFPRAIRIRSGKRLDRQLLLSQFGFDQVKYGSSCVGIEIPAHALSQVIMPPKVVGMDGSDSIGRAPPTKMPDGFLCSLVETLKAYQDDRWLTVREFADLVGVSHRTIQRRFSRFLEGRSFRDIVLDVKVHSAMKLLADSRRAITEIATQLGFSTPSNFSRSFKNITGLTPTDYRRTAIYPSETCGDRI